MNKYQVGDKVQWNDGVYHKDAKRIDVITEIKTDIFGSTRYMTKEVNNPKDQKPKIGMAFENYLVKFYE